MKKEKSTKMIAIFTVICALVSLISAFFSSLLPLYLFYKFNMDTRSAGSIGIIGGADGPTAVYVSGQSSSHLFSAIFALLAVLGIIYLVIAKYKKNHN
jgi:Na+-transporting methylmalonyl-CoA/oxaloacetate decarboxylase beta subunit